MRFVKVLFYALSLVGVASAAGPGWKLDKSCKTNDWETLVSRNVESAFSMASDELNAITKAIANENMGKYNDEIRQILKWMFMKDEEEPNEDRLGELKTRLTGLVSAQVRNDNETPDGKTIVIYCGLDRFEKTSAGGYYDKDIEETIEKGDSAIEMCKSALPIVAYTWVPKNRQKPSQIQLCPFFLNWMKTVDTKSLKNAQFKGLFYRAVSKGLAKLSTFLTPIDVMSMLDKVILHEMQHTLVGGQAYDVDGPNPKTVRYGWQRCRALAQEGDDDRYRSAQVNADTIALAGSAIRYVKSGAQVKEDGNVIV